VPSHTVSYVTVKEDGSDRYHPDNLTHKYSKVPAWMFHGTIVDSKKEPGIFWEKELGNINSTKYNEYILLKVEQFFREHAEEGYIFMQDNAPSYCSYKIRTNLYLQQIPYIKFPPYSPDLNLIEHVWNWMKNWI